MKKKLEIKKMNKKNKNNDLFYLQSELKKTELQNCRFLYKDSIGINIIFIRAIGARNMKIY